MEYIEHGDLGQYIRDNPTQAKREVQVIGSQVLEGLVVLHAREICHRDMKPQVTHPVDPFPSITDGSPLAEHPDCVGRTDVGKNIRFWGLQARSRHRITNLLWHNVL